MIIHEPTRTILLRSRQPKFLRQVIRRSRDVDFDDYNIAVRHGVEEIQVLRNMGIVAPSPILHYYDWPGRFDPFIHQRMTAAFMTYHRRGFILNDMGTGKTASILWALDFLMKEGIVKRAMIAAPLSTLNRVWRDEVFRVLMHRSCSVLHGTRAQRFDRLSNQSDFYVINHDGLGIIVDELIKRTDIDTFVLDESSVYRNSTTEKYKVLKKLVKARPDLRLYFATGAPCPNAPTDVWAPAKLVNPTKVPDYFGTFRDKVMMQLGPYKWVPKKGAYDEAYRVMQPAIRYKKEDCLDLPPVMFEAREVGLSTAQSEAYQQMKNHMALEYRDALIAGQVTAVNAADQVNKLRQILCGSVKIPQTGEYTVIDHGPRLQATLECIEQAGAKVIVVVPFKGIIRALVDEIRPHYTVEVLNGDVPPRERDEILTRFKNSTDPHVLLCHPRVMAHGLSLVEADTMVFYAPIYSNDEFQQVIERFNRPGQKRKMTVIRLGAHWLEWKIYKVLDGRRDTQDNILTLFELAMNDIDPFTAKAND